MADNLLIIAAGGGIAAIVGLVVAVLASGRIRRHGLIGTIRTELSPASKLKNPYRG